MQPFERDEIAIEDSALQRELQMLREALADVREDRDKWRDMAERLSLAPPTSKKVEKKSKFSRWQFWRND